MSQEIADFIRRHQSFAITSHARPDGDALGSEMGLALALEQLGKQVRIVNADPIPYLYDRLPLIERIERQTELEGDFDAVFILECGDLERPGLAGLEKYFIINIEHHPNTPPFGNLNWIDSSAAAVGEMVYDLAKRLGVQLDAPMATHLFVAISTDTGSFQYPNTTAHTFSVATDLVSAGADPGEIAKLVYLSQPPSRIRLLAEVLNTLQIHPTSKIAWIIVTQEMLKRAGATNDETEGIVNYPLSIDGIVMVAFFREDAPDRYRISLRSKNGYDVGSVAELYNGGGHRNASGLSIEGPFNEVRQRLIGDLEKLL